MNKTHEQCQPVEAAETPLSGSLPAHRRAIDFRRLREQVSLRDVLQLLGWQTQRGESVERLSGEVRGPCPVHKSSSATSRCFEANLERNL